MRISEYESTKAFAFCPVVSSHFPPQFAYTLGDRIHHEKIEKMEKRFIYITCKDRSEAMRLGRVLVEERLAACANVLDGMTSLYWWKGEVVEDQETILILKTTADLVEALSQKVQALHSYEVPCVVALPILGGNPDYLQWIDTETL